MNKFFTILLLSFVFINTKSQSLQPELFDVVLDKTSLANSKHVNFVDQSKQISMPADGMFLYSSLNNNGMYDIGYSINENYIVTISNPSHQKIRIRTQYVLLADSADMLSIYDGPNTQYPLIASYNGNLTNNELIVSHSDKITIHFKSNSSNVGRGFLLRLDEANLKSYALSAPNACLNGTPASDACSNAPIICNLNGYCGNTSGQYTPDHANPVPSGFCGSIENNSWLSFIASSTTASFGFISAGCQSTNSGIQAIMYATSNCSSFAQISNCVSQGSSSGSFVLTTNTSLIPGNKYYIMVDGFGGNVCNYSVTAQSGVSINPQIIANPTQICPGGSVNLSSSMASSGYTWTSSDGTLLPNNQTVSVTPTITTTYTLDIGTNACGSNGSVIGTITVTTSLPAPSISAPASACAGNAVTLGSLTNGGTYSWQGPNGFTSSLKNPVIPNFSNLNVGTYSLTITYGPGCTTQTGTVSIGISASPTIGLAVSPSNAICLGTQITLTASGGGETFLDPNKYTWTWNASQTSMSLCFRVAFLCVPFYNPPQGADANNTGIANPNQNTQICVSSTGSNGCKGTACQNIVILNNTGPLGVSPSVTTCPTQSVVLSANGASSYTWSPSVNLNSANGSTVAASPTTTTIYTVSGQGCTTILTNTVGVTVNNNPPTIGAITGSTSVCPNQTDVAFSVNDLAGTIYNWTLPSGAVITSTSSTSASIIVDFGNSGGTLSVTATNACGTSFASTTINISNTILTLSANPASICPLDSSKLMVSGANWYEWSPANSLSSFSGTTTSVAASPSVTTSYTVIGTQGACIDTAEVTVVVLPTTFFTVTANPSAICRNQSTTLTVSATGVSSYTWSTGSSQTSITVSPLSTTVYTVTGNTTCPSGNSVLVTVNQLPSILVNSPIICLNRTGTLSASGASTYTWSNGGNGNSQVVAPLSNTNYTVSGTDANGCIGSSVVNATVVNPKASFTGMDEVSLDIGTLLYLENTSTGATNYQWTLCSAAIQTGTTITIPVDTALCCVTLKAFNQQCSDSVTKCVVGSYIIIPNVFSPNGDHVNDLFKIKSSGLKEFTCTIFDRWGLKLYEWEDVNGYWDGKAKSGLAPSGTYFYIINYSDSANKTHTEKGYLTLFRD